MSAPLLANNWRLGDKPDSGAVNVVNRLIGPSILALQAASQIDQLPLAHAGLLTVP